jgi:hypothetical protein
MRILAFSALLASVAAALAAPASAQTVTTVLALQNAGSVTICPAQARFGGVINVADWRAGARQLQYKWTFSDVGDQPTQSVVAPSAGNITVTPVNIDIVNMKKSGSGWVQLTVSFPVNYTSPRINWVLTCPTPGSLSTGLTAPSGSNGGNSAGGAIGPGLGNSP